MHKPPYFSKLKIFQQRSPWISRFFLVSSLEKSLVINSKCADWKKTPHLESYHPLYQANIFKALRTFYVNCTHWAFKRLNFMLRRSSMDRRPIDWYQFLYTLPSRWTVPLNHKTEDLIAELNHLIRCKKRDSVRMVKISIVRIRSLGTEQGGMWTIIVRMWSPHSMS